MISYLSTRGQTAAHSFAEAVAAGLASDGGLFLPEKLPDISRKLPEWTGLTYSELAAEFFSLVGDLSREEWQKLTSRAYSKFDHPEIAPLRRLDQHLHLLELYHGPTLAFKDFALQLLGLLYERQVQQSGRPLTVLGATSGDTGSAAIHGCLGIPGIRIFILYPAGRVSPLQERQMACTEASNVFAIPILGTFDDAQHLVKSTFSDLEFARAVNLSAVNSINIARVLAQCVYYLWAWLKLPEKDRQSLEFVVPTGNFGNVLAGWLAQRMGAFPEATFRVATNQNDILYRFFQTGNYQVTNVTPSHAPSMDIQVASNFERFLYYLLGCDAARTRQCMIDFAQTGQLSLGDLPDHTFRSSRAGDDQLRRLIQEVWTRHRVVIDPHTACGFADLNPDKTSVILSTAHPAKFPEVVHAATGQWPRHPSLEALQSRSLQTYPLSADAGALKSFIRSRVLTH